MPGTGPWRRPYRASGLRLDRTRGRTLPCVRLPCYDVADIHDALRARGYACECEERRLLTRDM